MDEFEFASISDLELRMAAEDILTHLGREPTLKAIEDIIARMRQPVYKCVDDVNDFLGRKRKREEREAIKEEAAAEAEMFREVEEEKAAEKRSERMSEIIPDDYEQDDDLVFGFGLMQLLLCRMEKVGVNKQMGLINNRENCVELKTGDCIVIIRDGKIEMTHGGHGKVFELDPDNLDLIIDRIFLDS